MSDQDGRIPSDEAREPDEPDEPYEDFEDDTDEAAEARTDEAGLTAFGGPSLGGLFEPLDDDGDFDAQHNP